MVVASELRRLYFFSDFPQWDMKAYRETIRRVWSSRSVDEQIFRFLHFYDHNLATFLFFRIRRKNSSVELLFIKAVAIICRPMEKFLAL